MKLLSLFRGTTSTALWYLALVVVLPLISLSLLGIVWLWQQDTLLYVLAVWLLVTLLAYSVFIALPRQRRRQRLQKAREELLQGTSTGQAAAVEPSGGNAMSPGKDLDELQLGDRQLPDRLEEKPDWTAQDRAVWQELCGTIEQRLQEELPWQSLPDQCLKLLSTVSSHYNPGTSARHTDDKGNRRLEYRFTLPEALLVLSVASERYRRVVLQHVPFAERVTVASLVRLYDRQQDIRTGYHWLNTARRTLRLANPLAAAIGELRDQFTNRVFEHLSTNVQTDLKRLLLQEVVQVGIDLYSGKLKSSPAELEQYRSSGFREDLTQKPLPVEPLRIVLAGQVSAGKSSLVNALAATLDAEVDILPTTQSNVTHRLQLDGAHPIHLVDTVGLIDDELALQTLARLAGNVDMIVMVVRANQPARAPDQKLWQSLQSTFAAMPRRLVPPLILVMTHIDQLSPRSEWNPPYDLTGEQPKARNIRAALQSARQHIGLPEEIASVPVCLSPDKGYYNVEAVAAQIMLLQDSATLAQFNRRRLERGEQSVGWRERWQQIRRLGRVLGRAAIDRTPGRKDDV